jgi:uncharacterized protein YqeY
MSLEAQLNDALKQAMKDKDGKTSDVLRMIKTKIMERRTAKAGVVVDDELVRDTITAYRKSLQKALEEYSKMGDRGAEQADALVFEITVCERFLPKGLDTAAVTALVKERIAALQITDAKQVGRLLGDIMKSHKGLVDANEVKKIAGEILGG